MTAPAVLLDEQTRNELAVQCAIELNDVRCPHTAEWVVVIGCGSCLRRTGPEPFCTGHKDMAVGAGIFYDQDGCRTSAPVRVHSCEPL